MSKEITVRDLRNHGGRVLDRVASGEALTVTRHGRPVAELRPLSMRPVPADRLLRRGRGQPEVDPERLRVEGDEALDASL